MLKHKIDILFFRKISHVYLKISNFKEVGKMNQFKSIYKIGEREDQKKIKGVSRAWLKGGS